VVVGKGTSISTLSIKRLVIPLGTRHGDITVHVALRETY
jgi:CheY-specific phosphatase CheX